MNMKIIRSGKASKIKFCLGIILMALVFLTLVIPYQGFAAWRGAGEQIQQVDLDGDGTTECCTLADSRLTVAENNKIIWRSPPGWHVSQFVIADSINDGRPHLNLVVWKRGSYGTYRPFWFKGPDDEYCNHLYVFNMDRGRLKPFWMSSKIDPPILNLKIYDANADGRNELVVTEGSLDPAGRIIRGTMKKTIWRWDVWDFFRVDD
jgi:hypothetical protein